MKKIVLSLAAIVFIGSLAAGATGAFFNDTETSTGNTFTAGAIDLTVDSTQHYNGNVCVNVGTSVPDYRWEGNSLWPVPGTVCDGTWAATNLGAQKFWNFTDVKPGDEGENTVSLHVDSNDAWACIDVNVVKNDDNTQTEPEAAVDANGLTTGELAQNLKFAAWLDQGNTLGFQGKEVDSAEGDNIWQGTTTEPLMFSNQSGPASDVLGGKTYALADSTTGAGPIKGGVTNYIGLAWCAGTQTIVGNSITCDGAGMGNDTQTDSLEASVAFRVEQARNNGNFVCTPPVNNQIN